MSPAVVFTAPRQVEIRDEAVGAPLAGEVVVEAELSAISAGTELLVYRGEAPADLAADSTIASLSGSLAFPVKFGYSMVGRVVALGDGVDPAWQGRRVFAFHPHQARFVSRLEALTPLPDGLDAESAVLLPNMETAVNLVQDGRPMVGERVAVFGQGIVGLLTTTLLSRYPLELLHTVDRVEVRRTVSREAGAHVSSEIGPRDCDLTFELSGQPAALDDALAATRFSGRVVIGSWYGTRRAPIDLGGRFHRSRIRILASQVSTIDPTLSGCWNKSRRLDLALRLLHDIDVSHFITHRFDVRDAADAYALLDQCPEQAIQVVLRY